MAAIGDRIGSYVITGVIGRGAMATVYRAHDERLNRDVALKVLDAGYSLDFIFRARFEREFRVMAQVTNDHIVPVYDAGSWNDQLYIAMMLVDGPNLGQVLKSDGPLDLPRVTSIVSQVADALDAAHAQRIVHRDVKPANILLVRHGQSEVEHAYLADFGLTMGIEGTRLTRTGAFMGTLSYCAPEQLNSAPVDGRADEYALAATAFQALTGEPPFVRDNEMALVNAHLLDPPPRVTDLLPDLPPRLDAVIARGLAKRPEDRYRSAGEFAKAFATAAAGAKGAPAALVAAGGSQRRPLAVAAVVFGLVAAAVLGATITFALLGNKPASPPATASAGASLPAVAAASPTPAGATDTPPTPSTGPVDTSTPGPSSGPTRTPRPTNNPTPTPTTPPPTPTPTAPSSLPLVADGGWLVANSPSGVSGDPFVVVGEHHRRYVTTAHCSSEADCRVIAITFDSDTGERLGVITFKWNGSAFSYGGPAKWYSAAGGTTCRTTGGDLVPDAYTTHEAVSVTPGTTQDGLIIGMTGTKTISGTPTAAGTAAGCAPFAMSYTVDMNSTGVGP